jgi:hypothetical protein
LGRWHAKRFTYLNFKIKSGQKYRKIWNASKSWWNCTAMSPSCWTQCCRSWLTHLSSTSAGLHQRPDLAHWPLPLWSGCGCWVLSGAINSWCDFFRTRYSRIMQYDWWNI